MPQTGASLKYEPHPAVRSGTHERDDDDDLRVLDRNLRHPTPSGHAQRGTTDPALRAWVDEIAALTQPDEIVWCDGSKHEADLLTKQLVAEGKLIKLNPEWRPEQLPRPHRPERRRPHRGPHLHLLRPTRRTPGPTNNWRDPREMRAELTDVFDGSMQGRTMYVVPFSMGPLGGPLSHLGVQITDAPTPCSRSAS